MNLSQIKITLGKENAENQIIFWVIVILLSVLVEWLWLKQFKSAAQLMCLLGNVKFQMSQMQRSISEEMTRIKWLPFNLMQMVNLVLQILLLKVRYTAWQVKSGYESIVEAGVFIKILLMEQFQWDPANKTLAGTAWKFNLPNKIFWTGNLVIGFPLDGDMPFLVILKIVLNIQNNLVYIPTGHVKNQLTMKMV